MDIISISGKMKSREKLFFSAEAITDLVSSKDYKDFAGKSIPEFYKIPAAASKPEDITAYFEQLMESLIDDMRRYLPDALYKYFLLKYDFHNLGAMIENKDNESSDIYTNNGSVKIESLYEAVKINNYNNIPLHLRHPLKIAAGSNSKTAALLRINNIYYKTALDLITPFNQRFLDSYVRIEIDFANIRTFLHRQMESSQVLKEDLIDAGSIKKERFLNEDDLWKAVQWSYNGITTPLAPENFDIARNEAIMKHLINARVIPYGIEVIFSYFAAREVEIKNLRRITLGKFYNIDSKTLQGWILRPYQYV